MYKKKPLKTVFFLLLGKTAIWQNFPSLKRKIINHTILRKKYFKDLKLTQNLYCKCFAYKKCRGFEISLQVNYILIKNYFFNEKE